MSNPDTRITVALAGGVLLGALVAAASGPLFRQLSGGRLGYECTPSGGACICKGVLDCLDMGKDKKCEGKTISCSRGTCVCF